MMVSLNCSPASPSVLIVKVDHEHVSCRPRATALIRSTNTVLLRFTITSFPMHEPRARVLSKSRTRLFSEHEPRTRAFIFPLSDPGHIAKCGKSCRWQLTLDVATTGHEHGGFTFQL